MERMLPYNLDAEQGVLGSILIDASAYDIVAPLLKPEDFYIEAHRIIYETMIKVNAKRVPADSITICDELDREEKLLSVGYGGDTGDSYIQVVLVNKVPTSGNAEYYAGIVKVHAECRRVIGAATQMVQMAYTKDPKTLEKSEQLLFNLRSDKVSNEGFIGMPVLMNEYMDELNYLHEHRGSITGVPTGYADIDLCLGGLQKSDLILLGARPSMGKCLPHWTLIDNPRTGERLTLKEYVRRKIPTVYGVSETGEVRESCISHWIDSGVKPVFRVRTRLGRMVEVTGHHPFLTVNGWVSLQDLSVGHHIAVPVKVESFGSDESMPLDMVRLLAYFIAEGGLTHTSPVFTNTDPIIVDDFKKIVSSHFPELHVRQHNIDYAVCRERTSESMRGRGAILPKNPVTQWLEGLDLMGKLAQDKFFPDCVWGWSKRYLAEFIRILMSCDGCIYSFKGVPIIEFTVASERLARDVQHAFTRFGIVSKLSVRSASWRVEITTPEHVKRYQQEIGWFGEKNIRFAEYVHVISERGGNNGHAPKETWAIIKEELNTRKMSMSELARQCGETIEKGHDSGYNPHVNRGIPRYRLARYAEKLDSAQLKLIASKDIYWDEITSIENIGAHQVYDLTVPDGANFIAEDVFVHNTSFALCVGYNAALKGKKVAVFSLEMGRRLLSRRLMAMSSKVDMQRLRNGWIQDDEWETLTKSYQDLSQLPIWVNDTAGNPIASMRSELRRLTQEQGAPDLVIVDYLGLIEPDVDADKKANLVQQVSEISRGLKSLAREFDVPMLVLCQLSRAVEQRQLKVPQLSDLRDSGSLEQDADVVMFIYRDDYYALAEQRESTMPNQATIHIAKHRNGPLGDINLYWQADQTMFYNLDESLK